MDIEDQHPLRQRVEFEHITPILTWCFKSKKKPFKHDLQKSMLLELGMKMPKSEEQLKEDPFLILGYGINAFFDILLSLCIMFISITIFSLPIYYIYSSIGQKAFSQEITYPISRFLLGNMGGSSIFCHQNLMEKN
jgi:hypothetical protein